MRAYARGTRSGLLGLVLFACGGKTDDRSGGIADRTGGAGGVVSVATGGARGGVPASSGGGSGFVLFDGSPPRPPLDAALPTCASRIPLVYGGDLADCAWKIPELPPGRVFEPSHVNIETELNAEPAVLYYVSALSDCGETENTWFYDDEKSPTSLQLCPRACDKYLSAPGARLYFVIGCGWPGPMH